MIQKTTTHIAFLGPQGSYSHIAARQYAKHYCNSITEYSCQTFIDIINLVENNQAEYGILPIENSNSGLIDEVCDLLSYTNLILIKDITIPIQHHILVNDHTSLKKIEVIYSHIQPIQQCSKFLKKFPKWQITLCESSSVAIQTVAHLNQPNIAALGSSQGGKLYGLHSLLFPKIISNGLYNHTRFIILKNKNSVTFNIFSSTPIKIMIIISIDKKLEKLLLILKILKFYNIKINFLRLKKESSNKLKNVIILEIIVHLNNLYIQLALIKIRKISYSLKILGCYSSIISTINLFV